ncbi:MAG: GTPase ObgE [Christensenellales bacterium]
MFVDCAVITIRAGKGGNGSVHFLRDKHHIAGGPDGGNGGPGGSVYFVADNNQSNLVNFYYKRKYVAGNGGDGGGCNCNGKKGDDLIIKVPKGTVIKDLESGNVVADIMDTEKPVLVLSGGKGGRGNAFFATATRQTPAFSETGEECKEYKVKLELKVIADVGLVGLPNAGKSSLLSSISNANPKIANYHFTTLEPNLGVVKYYENSFVVADIPGLIEGASQGLGLGHDFLRHIERTRMLVHVVDISGIEGNDPLESFEMINKELATYSEKLAGKPMLVVLNKTDLLCDENIHYLNEFMQKYGDKYKVVKVSAVTTDGVKEFIDETYKILKDLPKVDLYEDLNFVLDERDKTSVNIEVDEFGTFVVSGGKIDELVRGIVLDDMQSFAYFQKRLESDGIMDELRDAGAKDGDSVRIKDIEFTIVD